MVNWWAFPDFSLSRYLHRLKRIALRWELENFTQPVSKWTHHLSCTKPNRPNSWEDFCFVFFIFLWLGKVKRWKIFLESGNMGNIHFSIYKWTCSRIQPCPHMCSLFLFVSNSGQTEVVWDTPSLSNPYLLFISL